MLQLCFLFGFFLIFFFRELLTSLLYKNLTPGICSNFFVTNWSMQGGVITTTLYFNGSA